MLVMMMGLPGSGKSTIAAQMAAADGSLVVTKDDIRNELRGQNSHIKLEHRVVARRDELIAGALAEGRSVISADTNFNPVHERRLRELAEQAGVEFRVVFVRTPPDQCVVQDARRDPAERVGEKVIRRMHRENRHRWDPEPYPVDPHLPWCVLCDIDGTLALIRSRSPFEEWRCGNDDVNPSVAWLLEHLPEQTRIVLFSARRDKYRAETEAWLAANAIEWDELHMRPGDTGEPDDEIKERMFNEHIRGRFNVRFVLDDRTRVVRTWRRLGLPTWQVNEGDF